MPLRDTLQNAIENETSGISVAALTQATEQLSERYRLRQKGKQNAFMSDDIHRNAYIVYRMPATVAAIASVLQKTKERIPDFQPQNLLDLGSGPGSALWASCEIFDSLQSITAFERDASLIAAGKRMAAQSGHQALQNTTWISGDLSSPPILAPHDIVIISYAFGELSQETRKPLLDLAWKLAKQALIIIEPGTPAGFDTILFARTTLMAAGAHIAAPCTHANQCPMKNGDWCHFSERLARTSLHRQAKGAQLNYEDEKHSYIAACKTPCEVPNEGRILRHPDKHSGHIDFILCTSDGLMKKTVSRRHGDAYKEAKKKEWGDVLR